MDIDLREDIVILRAYGGGPLTPALLAATKRLLDFLDGILVTWDELPDLPRGYCFDVLATGNEGICVPWTFQSDSPDEQHAYFAADVATGWLEELCATLDSDRAATIRATCGLPLPQKAK